MVYDFELYTNRPSYYSRDYSKPRYYTSYYSSSYTPSYGSYLHDRYYCPHGYYSPWYRSSSNYARARAYLNYRPNYDYKYEIPDYTYRHYSTYPMSRLASPIYPEAEKYAHTFGVDFDSATRDIRSSTIKLLQECRQSVPRAVSIPRFVRASSLEPSSYSSNDEYYRSKRAVSRTRMMSEEPSYYHSQFY